MSLYQTTEIQKAVDAIWDELKKVDSAANVSAYCGAILVLIKKPNDVYVPKFYTHNGKRYKIILNPLGPPGSWLP